MRNKLLGLSSGLVVASLAVFIGCGPTFTRTLFADQTFTFVFAHAFILSACFSGAFTAIALRRVELKKSNSQFQHEVRARQQAEAAMQESAEKYQVLFAEVPTPLWEIDLSDLKNLLAELRRQGIESLRTFFARRPEAVAQCLEQVKIVDVNHAVLRLLQADSKAHLLGNVRKIWNAEAMNVFKEQLIAIAEGSTANHFESSIQTLQGKKIDIWGHWQVLPNHESRASRVFIATFDTTQRKKFLDTLQISRERLRELSAHLQSLGEQERVAIARNLHDELGQSLTALKMDLSRLERKAEQARDKFDFQTIAGEIGSLQQLVATTINTVRNLIKELRPEALDTLGLVPALEWQLEEFHKRTGLAHEFHSAVEELNLAKDHAIAVFRIFQESLTNIARHANANTVRAQIKKHDHALWVEIADNGRGISAEELNAPGKFGLLGMRERALLFGGEVSITGAPGRGTTVKVKVPLPD